MSEVWKYPLEIADEQRVAMPQGAEILHVDAQPGVGLCLWARVDPDAPLVDRVLLMRGTGHPVGAEPHLGSSVTAGGLLVWHVFDGGETPC